MFKDITNNHCFVHIPGTAGTVVWFWMDQLARTEPFAINFEYFVRKDKQWFLDQEFKGKLDSTSDVYEEYLPRLSLDLPMYMLKHQPAKYNDDPDLTLYTIIRNPYERQLVDYFNLLQCFAFADRHKTSLLMPQPTIGRAWVHDSISYTAENRGIFSGFDQIITRDQLKNFGTYIEWKTEQSPNELKTVQQKIKEFLIKPDQYHFTHDDDGNDLIDIYIRYENLNQDWNKLATKLKYPKDIFNMKVNWTVPMYLKDKHYSFFYDDKIKETVDRLVYRDCKTFDYQFEWK
jgi:hypothetical protein